MELIDPGCSKYADNLSDVNSLPSLSHLQMGELIKSGDLISVYFNIIQNTTQIISYMAALETVRVEGWRNKPL